MSLLRVRYDVPRGMLIVRCQFIHSPFSINSIFSRSLDLSQLLITDQVLYHTPTSSFSYWDNKQESYIFSTKDLPFFVRFFWFLVLYPLPPPPKNRKKKNRCL